MDNWLLDIWYQLPGGNAFLVAAGIVAYLESLVAVGLLMPGSTLIVLSGFLAYHGKADIVPLMAWSAVGALLGDITSYWLGARFGHPLGHVFGHLGLRCDRVTEVGDRAGSNRGLADRLITFHQYL